MQKYEVFPGEFYIFYIIWNFNKIVFLRSLIHEQMNYMIKSVVLFINCKFIFTYYVTLNAEFSSFCSILLNQRNNSCNGMQIKIHVPRQLLRITVFSPRINISFLPKKVQLGKDFQ